MSRNRNKKKNEEEIEFTIIKKSPVFPWKILNRPLLQKRIDEIYEKMFPLSKYLSDAKWELVSRKNLMIANQFLKDTNDARYPELWKNEEFIIVVKEKQIGYNIDKTNEYHHDTIIPTKENQLLNSAFGNENKAFLQIFDEDTLKVEINKKREVKNYLVENDRRKYQYFRPVFPEEEIAVFGVEFNPEIHAHPNVSDNIYKYIVPYYFWSSVSLNYMSSRKRFLFTVKDDFGYFLGSFYKHYKLNKELYIKSLNQQMIEYLEKQKEERKKWVYPKIKGKPEYLTLLKSIIEKGIYFSSIISFFDNSRIADEFELIFNITRQFVDHGYLGKKILYYLENDTKIETILRLPEIMKDLEKFSIIANNYRQKQFLKNKNEIKTYKKSDFLSVTENLFGTQIPFEQLNDKELKKVKSFISKRKKNKEYIKQSKCKHFEFRNKYNSLDPETKNAAKLFMRMYNLFYDKKINSNNPNKNLNCEICGIPFSCNHEYLLSKKILQKDEKDKTKYEIILDKEYVVENYNVSTCRFCGRGLKESKKLEYHIEFDKSGKANYHVKVSLKESKEIENTIIQIIQKNDPDPFINQLPPEEQIRLELMDKMEKDKENPHNYTFAFPSYDMELKERILSKTEYKITQHYRSLEKNSRTESTKNVYKKLAKVLTIYSYLVYEIYNYRISTLSVLDTLKYPFKIKDENSDYIHYDENLLLKRCLFLFRKRFSGLNNLANKLGKNEVKNQLIIYYKDLTKFLNRNSSKKLVTNSDNLEHVDYMKPEIKLVLERIQRFEKVKEKNIITAKLLKMFRDFNELVRNPSLIIEPNSIIQSTYIGLTPRYYNQLPASVSLFKLIDDKKSQKNEIILPIDYNQYGVPQKFNTIELVFYSGKSKRYNLWKYKKLEKEYIDIENSGFDPKVILGNFVPKKHFSVKKVEYYNQENISKTTLQNKEYSVETQQNIRKKIKHQEIFYLAKYILYDQQNNKLNKYFRDKKNITFDEVTGFKARNYDEFVNYYFESLGINPNKKRKGKQLKTNKLNENLNEKKNEETISVKLLETVPVFDNLANQLVTIITKGIEIKNKNEINKYYKYAKKLGRLSLQEEEEIEKYPNIPQSLKSQSKEEIITKYTIRQTEQIYRYIKNIILKLNILANGKTRKDLEYISGNKFVLEFLGKVKVNKKEIKEISNYAKKIWSIPYKEIGYKEKVFSMYEIFLQLLRKIISTSGKWGTLFCYQFVMNIFKQDQSTDFSYKLSDYEYDLRQVKNAYYWEYLEKTKLKGADPDTIREIARNREKYIEGIEDINDLINKKINSPQNPETIGGSYEDY